MGNLHEKRHLTCDLRLLHVLSHLSLSVFLVSRLCESETLLVRVRKRERDFVQSEEVGEGGVGGKGGLRGREEKLGLGV